MIPTYFDSPEKLEKLQEAVQLLLRTPFCPNSEAPGPTGGIDCIHTENFLYRYCGAIVQIDIPRQRMDYGQHAQRSLLIEAFETWPELRTRFAALWTRSDESAEDSLLSVRQQLLPGDSLCFLSGAIPHHGAVYLGGGDIIHTLKSDGVHTMRLDAVFRGWRLLGYLAAVYRPLPRD